VAAQIDGIALGLVAAGGFLVYAGIQQKSVSSLLTGFIQGKVPSAAAASTSVITGTGPGTAATSAVSGGQGVAAESNEATLKATAATFGWTEANGQWQALNSIEEAEAGYNLTAQNPTSDAYGEAQFIDGPSEYAQYGGDSTTAAGQSVAMCNYIKQRYGSPIVAWAFHLANGYY
jgi:colicin import membrane protein